jgi:hypothetical protein
LRVFRCFLTSSIDKRSCGEQTMLLSLLAVRGYQLPLRLPATHAPRHAAIAAMCGLPAPDTMKASALKAELDGLGVAWRGVCFEKDDLVNALVDARASPASPAPSWADVLEDASATATPPPPPPPSPPPSPSVPPTSRSDAFANSVLAEAQREADEVNAMSEELIKAELKSLGVVPPAAEKAELVAALLNARANSTPMFDTSQFGDKGTQW